MKKRIIAFFVMMLITGGASIGRDRVSHPFRWFYPDQPGDEKWSAAILILKVRPDRFSLF
jgi:hypothetical protein